MAAAGQWLASVESMPMNQQKSEASSVRECIASSAVRVRGWCGCDRGGHRPCSQSLLPTTPLRADTGDIGRRAGAIASRGWNSCLISARSVVHASASLQSIGWRRALYSVVQGMARGCSGQPGAIRRAGEQLVHMESESVCSWKIQAGSAVDHVCSGTAEAFRARRQTCGDEIIGGRLGGDWSWRSLSRWKRQRDDVWRRVDARKRERQATITRTELAGRSR